MMSALIDVFCCKSETQNIIFEVMKTIFAKHTFHLSKIIMYHLGNPLSISVGKTTHISSLRVSLC